MLQRLQNPITVSCFAHPTLSPARAQSQEGYANTNETNWTKTEEKCVHYAVQWEGGLPFVSLFFFSWWSVGGETDCMHKQLISLCCAMCPHCPLERSEPHDLLDAAAHHTSPSYFWAVQSRGEKKNVFLVFKTFNGLARKCRTDL